MSDIKASEIREILKVTEQEYVISFTGEILQIYSTYDCKLATTADFSDYTSQSLSDFIYESNKVR